MVLTEENEKKSLRKEILTNTVAKPQDIMMISNIESNKNDLTTVAITNAIKPTTETAIIGTNLVDNDRNEDNNYLNSTNLQPEKSYESLDQLNDGEKASVENHVQHPSPNDSFNDSILIDQYHQEQYQPLQSVLSPLAPEYPYKHPLENTWTLWYLESDRTKSWEELQNEITSFNTVEDFWYLYHHIKLASEIKIGSDYSLFKKGVRPMWEDEANIKGGRWVITLSRQYRRNYLDNLWLDVLLCLIGEIFDYSGQICGAVVNIRGKVDRISVWTADSSNQEAVLEIGNKLKEYLNYDSELLTLSYQIHKDTIIKQGSSVRNIYTLQ